MPGFRATTYNVYSGDDSNSELMLRHSKGTTCGTLFTLPTGHKCPSCCCLPYLNTYDANGTKLGSTKILCSPCIFVPKLGVFDGLNHLKYIIRPDTCCLCCIKCNCGGSGANCCSMPCYLRDPKSHKKLHPDAAIVDLWSGAKKTCCTRQSAWSVTYPPDCETAMKSTLMGSAILLDMSYVENG